jgi:adenylate cyclase
MPVWLAATLLLPVVVGLLIHGERWRRRAAVLDRRLSIATQHLERLQAAFSRFAPAAVVEEIIARGVSTRSEKKQVTVLFADLKGFTAMSETLDPAVLVEILNGYFVEMGRVISEHRGHVSKFIGDGILALFGALRPNPWQVNDAAHAALAMRAALTGYNRQLRERGYPELSIGVGLHTGTVIGGVFGSAELIEYTVIGSVVNLSARVEGLTRSHRVDILITEAVKSALDPRFQLHVMPATEVKGLSAPVVTYAVEGFADIVAP